MLACCADAGVDGQVASDAFMLAGDLFDPLAVDWRKFFTLVCGFLPNTTSIRDTVCHVVSLLDNEAKDGISFELFSQLFDFSASLDPQIVAKDIKAYLAVVKNAA